LPEAVAFLLSSLNFKKKLRGTFDCGPDVEDWLEFSWAVLIVGYNTKPNEKTIARAIIIISLFMKKGRTLKHIMVRGAFFRFVLNI
jgi:hypothetical protein